jgi:hypothetical protein
MRGEYESDGSYPFLIVRLEIPFSRGVRVARRLAVRWVYEVV